MKVYFVTFILVLSSSIFPWASTPDEACRRWPNSSGCRSSGHEPTPNQLKVSCYLDEESQNYTVDSVIYKSGRFFLVVDGQEFDSSHFTNCEVSL